MDIFVENGLVGGIIFAGLIFLIIKNSLKEFLEGNILDKSIFGILIALFVLFQLGHYHKFYFLFILFFFIAGLLYSERENVKDKYEVALKASGILFLLNLIIVISFLFFNYKNYIVAYKIYPLSVSANQSLVLEYYDNKLFKQAENQLEQLYTMYPEEPIVLDFIGNFYQNFLVQTDAIRYFQSALLYSPQDVTFLVYIYEELEKYQGAEVAKEYVEKYIKEHEISKRNPSRYSEMSWFYDWCGTKNIEYISK